MTYAAALAGPVSPFQPRGSLNPTAMCSDLSDTAVSSETANKCMSHNMFRPLSDKPGGTTKYAQVTKPRLPAGERPNKTPIFITEVNDTRNFLAWLWASCPGGPKAQQRARNRWQFHQPPTGSEPRSAHCGPLMVGGCELAHLQAPGGPLCGAPGEEPG